MKLAIFDRDGTLNALGEGFIDSPGAWQPLPGALEALARLSHAGWRLVLATNQPGLGRGLFDAQTLAAIHAKLHRQVAALGARIDAIFYCPHAESENCDCRKPAPGLMLQICERFGVDAGQTAVVGSCPAHLQMAADTAAQLHMVCSGRAAALDPQQPLPPGWPERTRAHASLAAVVDCLLAQTHSPSHPVV